MKLIIALALAGALMGQSGNPIVQQKEASQSASFYTRQALASTAGKITVQACSFCGQFVGEFIIVSSTVACNVSFLKNGSVASTTAGTALQIADVQTGGYTPPNVFTASNSTGGTALGPITPLAAGGSITYDISKWYLGNGWPNSKNYSIVTDCTTGTTDIYIQWRKDLP